MWRMWMFESLTPWPWWECAAWGLIGLAFSFPVVIAEADYLVHGQTAAVRVKDVTAFKERVRSLDVRRRHIDYEFTESDGTLRTGRETVSEGFRMSEDRTVLYTPGADGRARLTGAVPWLRLCVFVGSLALTLVGLSWWLRARSKRHLPETASAPKSAPLTVAAHPSRCVR
jgi:hypothetical protein